MKLMLRINHSYQHMSWFDKNNHKFIGEIKKVRLMVGYDCIYFKNASGDRI